MVFIRLHNSIDLRELIVFFYITLAKILDLVNLSHHSIETSNKKYQKEQNQGKKELKLEYLN